MKEVEKEDLAAVAVIIGIIFVAVLIASITANIFVRWIYS